MVEAPPWRAGVLRVSLASGLIFWVEGRTLACVGMWVECTGKAKLALCLERVLLLGGSLWGFSAPVFVIFSVWGQTCCVAVKALDWLVFCVSGYHIYHTVCACTGRYCCRSWPRPDTGCPWEATSSDLMPQVSCEGRLWCWNCLRWVVVVGLRVNINTGGGVECFIEVGINEDTNVDVVHLAIDCKNSCFRVLAGEDFLDNSSVKLFGGWKVHEGCQSIECHFTFGINLEVLSLELSHCDDHGTAGGREVMYPQD
eukprot:1149159-Pelagomonas_calceolata.AAC.3